MKRTVTAVCLACLMAACSPGWAAGMPSEQEKTAAQEEKKENQTSIEGEWTNDSMDARYRLEDGSFLENSWLLYKGYWYYLDEDGYCAAGWKKIKGSWYYFNEETGKMTVGWAYSSDEDEWYYLNEDGTRKTGWLKTGDAWYWFDSDGVMYDEGWRMVDGHKYYFNRNGKLASSQYIGTDYYGADGLRDREHDMTIQGKRKPEKEEQQQITEALENIPPQWMERFQKSGWEFMYYTDRKYIEAPMTDEGIYYVYHKTDVHYKKIKFTDPSSLTRAFGEYVAYETGNDREKNVFLADLYQLLEDIPSAHRLPEYFDDDSRAWFGILFENYMDPEIRSEMRLLDPQLCSFMDQTLGTDFQGQRPSVWDMTQGGAGEYGSIIGTGPSVDPELNPALRKKEEESKAEE